MAIELAEAMSEANASTNGPSQLALTVRDDGRGIDPSVAPGFGLRGMQERVQALGGSCVVEGAAGRGTQVHITIPIGPRIDGGAA